MQVVNKTVMLDLASIEDNDALIIEAFQKQAAKEKWTQEEIDAVTREALNGDQEHLYEVLWDHCTYEPDEWEKVDDSLYEELEPEDIFRVDDDDFSDFDDIDWESEDFEDN